MNEKKMYCIENKTNPLAEGAPVEIGYVIFDTSWTMFQSYISRFHKCIPKEERGCKCTNMQLHLYEYVLIGVGSLPTLPALLPPSPVPQRHPHRHRCIYAFWFSHIRIYVLVYILSKSRESVYNTITRVSRMYPHPHGAVQQRGNNIHFEYPY